VSLSEFESASPARWRFVPAAGAVALERWDPESSLQAHVVGSEWRTLAELGVEITEGFRPGRSSGPEPLTFRPSHLDGGLLMPDAEHIAALPVRSSRAVAPGDVVVSKFLPARAGIVMESTPRHVPDANCLRIIGLRPDRALWLVSLMEHPDFASHLARRSSGQMLPRVGARDLGELAIPPVPAPLSRLATEWFSASEIVLEVQRGILDLRREAQAIADDTAPEPPDVRLPIWLAADEVPDTWAPDQAALGRYQRVLARAGWVSLRDFLLPEPARLRDGIPPARVLHLGDATAQFGFRVPEIAAVQPPWFRLYADPLRPGEVLLSTLGTSPKVVVNDPPCPFTVWLSDQWARLDGGAVSGALALLLETRQVTWQLGCATTGAVRQFIGREELGNIRLPAPSSVVARGLHRALMALLARRSEAQSRVALVRAELANLVTHSLAGVP
jgi:hypothetical protein